MVPRSHAPSASPGEVLTNISPESKLFSYNKRESTLDVNDEVSITKTNLLNILLENG